MTTNLPHALREAVEVLDIIEDNGFEAYFVGGCLRDYLLQRPIQDVDITTVATPRQLMDIFEAVIPVGLEHGTIIVRYKKASYEITTFRHESLHTSNRLLSDDLQRRDFTMNAIAMNRHGKIIDLFSGQLDLEARRIRSVGSANDRFKEDPLRILRAVRFISQLNFAVEETTFSEMKRLKQSLETVAIERVVDELQLIFQGEFVQAAIDVMKQLEVQTVIPVLGESDFLLDKLPENLTSFVTLSEVIALFHYLDRDISISTWINNWKLSNKIKNVAETLVFALDYYEQHGINNWLAYTLSKDDYHSFIHLVSLVYNKDINKEVDTIYDRLIITSRTEIAIDGNDLQRLFKDLPRGKWISETLKQIEYNIVMGKLANTKIAIKEWVQCHPPDIN